MYDFADASGPVVRDRAGSRSPIDLKIEDLTKVRRLQGSLTVRGPTLIRSDDPPKRFIGAIKRSGAITIEAWLTPAKSNLSGPARIVTLSKDSVNRNFTLGQEGDKFDVRFRTSKTSANGLPSSASNSDRIKEVTTHVAFTLDRDGNATIWINGEQDTTRQVEGSFSNWDGDMRFALANEMNKSRAWLGTYHLVAIYKRALSAEEVSQNYAAGPRVLAPQVATRKQRDPREVHFELEVAPILANHCLECHDSLVKKGSLDLSKKIAAAQGGDSGKALHAANAEESLLWQLIESDEMPQDRAPLSRRDKETLKKWINDGAVWSLDSIDPAIYVHGGRPDANWLRRLTIPEYIETVRSVFGIDISNEAHELLPPDVRADGFSNTAYNLNVDLKHIEAYQALAEIIVRRADLGAFTRQFRKRIKLGDKDMEDLIKKMGRVILRGPLTKREINSFLGIYTTSAATEDANANETVALIVEAMLQSPRFIYRIERQRGDGSPEPVDDFELASRISYIVWGAPPDQPLLDAAAGGDLYDEVAIRNEVARMLDDERAMRQSERFFSDWINLPRLNNLQPNQEKFPDWDPALVTDMQKETIAFFREVAWRQNRPLADLLNAKVTFATPRLAKHYGLPADAADLANSDGELVRFDLNKTQARGGILTQGSLLTVGGDEASMVTRGLLVMHELLRGVVKDPPPCVDTTPVPTKAGLSQRVIAEGRIANEACGGLPQPI